MGLTMNMILSKHPEHHDLMQRRQELKAKLNDVELRLMNIDRVTQRDERRELILEKDDIVTELQQVNESIKGKSTNINSFIVEIIKESLPDKIYSVVQNEAYRRSIGEKPTPVSLLSEEEENSMAYFKSIDQEYKELKLKVRKFKQAIDDEIPNIAKAKTEKEYLKATAVFKVLSKLNTILGSE